MNTKHQDFAMIPRECISHAAANYLICTTERSGSTLLCRLLSQLHIGNSDEYLNKLHYNTKKWHDHFQIKQRENTFKEYFEQILLHAKTQKNVCGLKIMWQHLAFFYQELMGIHPATNTDKHKLINTVFPNIHYIYLYRADMLRQAISFYKARQSGIWHIADPSKQLQVSKARVPFSFKAIKHLVTQMIHNNAYWKSFFRDNAIKPLTIEYHQVVQAPTQTVVSIAEFLGLDSTNMSVSDHPLQRVSDEKSDEIYNQYLSIADEPASPTTFHYRQTDNLKHLERNRTKTAIVVLGMHRSGTSALTRVLNIFGAKIGDDLFPSHEVDNPAGYWENNAFYKVNEGLLKGMGLDYLVSDDLPAGWLESPAAAEARTAIRTALQTQLANATLVAIKDPRLCFLGPLYFGVLEELGFAVKVVMPLRAPAEVAASLARRHDNPPVEFEAIWARTVLSAERISRPYPRVITTYTDLLENPLALYDSIGSALDLTWPVGQQEAAKAVSKFIDPALHRNVSDEPSAAPAISALYTALSRIRGHAPGKKVCAYLDSWEADYLFLFGALRSRAARAYELERRLTDLEPTKSAEEKPETQTPHDAIAARRAKALQAGKELLNRLEAGHAEG